MAGIRNLWFFNLFGRVSLARALCLGVKLEIQQLVAVVGLDYHQTLKNASV